ncbi:Putative monooxygenase [Corynebacterium provencense]|uniref:Monooxygenase n=1 Tax=Corynebacterium provencense TaxID=1737425 RepID=A0A2Z3YML1_9CORY|nr:nitronate monooxygenase [Corynebacterium provencense]AWT25178.1 Putative monooxygenase [Corynebacterium provencense]
MVNRDADRVTGQDAGPVGREQSTPGSSTVPGTHRSPGVLATRLTRLWGVDLPLVGAPMAGRAGGRLAAAVSAAGGLGMIGVGARSTPAWITGEAETAGTGGNFGIGLMVWALDAEAADNDGTSTVFDAAVEANPTVLSLAFGDPAPWVPAAHRAGISVVAPVNDMLQVRQALAADVDVLCVQGTDAGGHTGRLGTMPLMQEVLDFTAVQAPGVPVVVAGGIGTGRGVAAALAAGADGAWIGTALLASPEAEGDEELRAAAVKAGSGSTVLTGIYDRAEQQAWDITLWPTRTVRNAFVDRYVDDATVTDGELVAARAPGGPYAGELKLHAGQSVGLVRQQAPAGDVVRRLADEAERLLGRF